MRSIEVVICTHNRLELLKENLDLNLQTISEFSNVSITVVDSNSSDGTLNYLNTMQIRTLYSPVPGLSVARNLGISNSRGDFLTFLDDDAFLSQSFIPRLLGILDTADPEIVGGAIWPEANVIFPKWFFPGWEKREKSKISGFVNSVTFSGSNLTVKASLFQKIGNFNPALGMIKKEIKLGEEKELMYRYFNSGGTKAYYDPSLIVYVNVLPEKLRYKYRFIRELAPLMSNRHKVDYKLFLKTSTYFNFRKNVFNLLKLNNFTPYCFLDKILYLSLILCRAISNVLLKKSHITVDKKR